MTTISGVPFRPDDLPRFAGELYERVRGGASVPSVSSLSDAVSVLGESGGGAVDTDTFDPTELLAYVLAVVVAEAGVPDDALVERASAAERRHRVEEAVRRIVGHRV